MNLLGSPTVVELAGMLHVKRSTLSSWIHTDREPPLKVGLRIAEITGVKLKWLVHGGEWDISEDEIATESLEHHRTLVVKQINRLNVDQLQVIQTILHYYQTNPAINPSQKPSP